MSFPRTSQFPSAAAAAFGSSRHTERGPSVRQQTQFNQEASDAFSRKKQGQTAFDTGASMAFSKEVKPNVGDTFAAFSKGPQPTNNFDTQANSAFGKTTQSRNGFDTMASAAFGKKPTRQEEERSRPTFVIPKRTNDLGSIMEHYLGTTEREYGNSALSQRRKAAAAVPVPEKIEEMVWPELAPSKVATTTAAAKPVVSFAEIMKKRLADDAAAAAEAALVKAKEEAAKKRDALDLPAFIPHRFPTGNHIVSRPVEEYEEEQESDLDYLSPNERRKHDYELPMEDDHYDQVDNHEEDAHGEDEDDYYRR